MRGDHGRRAHAHLVGRRVDVGGPVGAKHDPGDRDHFLAHVEAACRRLERLTRALSVAMPERGGISVAWGIDPSSDTDRWTFSVQDTGAGMAPDEARRAVRATS